MNSTNRTGCVIWFTGLSGAGKTTLSSALAPILTANGIDVEVLDGDEVRTHLSAGLTFSKEDRDINVRRIGFVARLLAKHGIVAITAAISPYRAVRDEVRAECERNTILFFEIFVDCPVEILTERDVKGLYKRALAGEIKHFTGITDPYEPPINPEVTVNSGTEIRQQSLDKIVGFLRQKSIISAKV